MAPMRMETGFNVVPKIDIWRCANLMMKRYGQNAGLEAAQRADAMLEKGDMDGCRVWKRILKAIEELERINRQQYESIN